MISGSGLLNPGFVATSRSGIEAIEAPPLMLVTVFGAVAELQVRQESRLGVRSSAL